MPTSGHLLRGVLKTRTLIIAATLCVGTASLDAQTSAEPPRAPESSPSTQGQREPSPKMFQQSIDAMAPMMARMAQASLEAVLEEIQRKETAEAMATYMKNFYDALVARGFSREDALKIVLAHGPPGLPASR